MTTADNEAFMKKNPPREFGCNLKTDRVEGLERQVVEASDLMHDIKTELKFESDMPSRLDLWGTMACNLTVLASQAKALAEAIESRRATK